MRVPSRPVCQLCDFLVPQSVSRRAFITASTIKNPSLRRQTARTQAAIPRIPARRIQTNWRNVDKDDFPEDAPAPASPQATSESVAAVKKRLAEMEAQIRILIDSNKVESEKTIYGLLEEIYEIAQSAIALRSRQPPPTKATIRQSSAGAILSGLSEEEPPKASKASTKTLGLNALPTPTYLSQLAEGLLKHPAVFIGPSVLELYVHLQRLLNRPHAIPEILYLYAHKPVPQEGSSPFRPRPSTGSGRMPPAARLWRRYSRRRGGRASIR